MKDDDDDESEDDEPIELEPDKKKASWPKLMTHDGSTKTQPADEYGPIHPMDTKRLEAARLKQAEALVMAQDDSDDEEREEQTAEDGVAREKFRIAMESARRLQQVIRARDPEQAAEAATEAMGHAAVAAALDPKDAAAQLAAANEAARVAAHTKFPGVFVGATHPVEVRRKKAIQDAREGLPILGVEHDIVDHINHNPVTVICGETGCGKTTQVPQFLYESGYGDPACSAHPGAVAVTQPRRVAVTSTATRVAQELNVPLGNDVGYQVRYDRKVGDTPRIKFMTDGILLREIQSDLLLRKYSVVIVDEAHERSVNTDILLGLLSRVVPLRAELAGEGGGITPLRLVVMSATLRVEEFVGNKRLCPTPPALLKVAARQFPVTIHFSRRTEHMDYLGAAKKKALAIHRKLPPGGILIFLTGQREVDGLVRKLREGEFGPKKRDPKSDEKDDEDLNLKGDNSQKGIEPDTADEQHEERGLDPHDVDALDAGGEDVGADADERNLTSFEGVDDFDEMSDHDDSASDISEDEEDVVVHGGEGVTPEEAAKAEDEWVRAHAPTVEAGGGDDGKGDVKDDGPGPMYVLPLYAMLPPQQQALVFDPPPAGHRLVVVATNVAETSLTIPGVRYVVDAGREKRRVFGDDAGGGGGGAASAGLSRFTVGWVSKASAEQRAGRAGRTGPGHCYRLFSSAHFVNDLEPHAPPAIAGVPIDGVVLQMRAMGIDRVDRFPFITPPDTIALQTAQRTLAILGALRATRANGRNRTHGHGGSFGDEKDPGELTQIGIAMAALPISPRHSRMLLAAASSRTDGCLAAAVASAAALSLQSPFLGEESERSLPADISEDERKRRRKLAHKFHHHNSDALSAAKALVAYDRVRDHRKADVFCSEHRLHARTMREMSDLRRQLLRILASPPASVASMATTVGSSFLSPHAVAAVAEATAAITGRRDDGEKEEARRRIPRRSRLKSEPRVNPRFAARCCAAGRIGSLNAPRLTRPPGSTPPPRRTRTAATAAAGGPRRRGTGPPCSTSPSFSIRRVRCTERRPITSSTSTCCKRRSGRTSRAPPPWKDRGSSTTPPRCRTCRARWKNRRRGTSPRAIPWSRFTSRTSAGTGGNCRCGPTRWRWTTRARAAPSRRRSSPARSRRRWGTSASGSRASRACARGRKVGRKNESSSSSRRCSEGEWLRKRRSRRSGARTRGICCRRCWDG